MATEHFRANTPHIIHEVIEGEAILVNLESGAYYSTDQAGAAVWDAIANGLSVNQTIARLADQYDGDPQAIRAGVLALVSELEQEGLILPHDASPANDAALTPSAPRSDKPPFVAPVLRKYTDLAELLLLDPIHDVDDSGWPNRQANHQTQ